MNPTPPPPDPGASPQPTGPLPTTGDPAAAAVMPVRLLTRVEYNNTVRDLLNDPSQPANAFPGEHTGETGFAKVQQVDDVHVTAYLDAADALATRATADPAQLLGCDPAAANEDACVRGFIAAFGKRAYRRPLADADVGEHFTYYKTKLRGELKKTPREAVRLLVTAMLQSPYFLYRWELGWLPGAREGAVLRLNPYQLASQLSYFLWSSMPDAELFRAADARELDSPEQIEKQARRMLKDPRADGAVASFHEQWLGAASLAGMARNTKLFKEWGRPLAEAMLEELRRFSAEAVLRKDGRVETLFTSTSTFVDGRLAAHYGLPGVAAAAPFQAATLPAAQRAGILTLAGVMAAHADENKPSPILRGMFVREHVMCDHILPAPPGVPDLPPETGDVPRKQFFAAHAAGSCKACHDLMDPIGFAFENYDAIGKYQTMDGKFPVDATGELKGLDGKDHRFANALELTKLLSTSEQVRGCLVRQWFRFGAARNETAADDHALATAATAFRQAGHDVRELLVALVKSRAFTHRAVSVEEVLR